MAVNPYDLVPIHINGQLILARPIEWDSVPVSVQTTINSLDCVIRPTKIVLTCPDCGQLVTHELAINEVSIHIKCQICQPEIIKPTRVPTQLVPAPEVAPLSEHDDLISALASAFTTQKTPDVSKPTTNEFGVEQEL